MRETPGQVASATVLADIEATVDGRCACGCGTRLGPRSNSAWFASHDCQARWNARNAGIDQNSLNRLLTRVRDLQQRPIIRTVSDTNRVDLRIHATTEWLGFGNNRALIIAWVEANGIDHQTVPADNTIEVAGNEIRLDVHAWHAGELQRERLAVPHQVPLDATLLTNQPPPVPRVMWAPAVADPAHPTAAELEASTDLTDYVVPGSITFHEPDNSGCIFPTRFQTERSPLLLQRAEWRGGLIAVPDEPGTYRIVINGAPLADIAVVLPRAWWRRIFSRKQPNWLTVNQHTSPFFGRRPAPQPWWRRVLNRLTGKA
jgi:hypothetical protein